ncbi:hypothetical protein Tco_0448456, partial [Tanacetum coccineum]
FLYDGYSPDAVTISLMWSLNNPDGVASILDAVSTFFFDPTLWDVNTDDSTDKSLFETSVQHVTQYKAPTDKKTKRKRIPPSSKPKTSKVFRESPLKEKVANTQPIEEPVATADTTQSLGKSGEVKGYPRPNRVSESAFNIPIFLYTLCLHSGNDTERSIPPDVDPENSRLCQEIIVEKAEHVVEEEDPNKGIDSGIVSIGNVRLKDVSVNNEDNPFDTESKIKVVKRFQPWPDDEDQITFLGPVYNEMDTDPNMFTIKTISGSLSIVQEDVDPDKADSDLVSMPEDDIKLVDDFDVNMDDPNITMEEYIRPEEEKVRKPIVFDDAFTSEVTHSCEPMVSPINDNKIDFRISFDESDDEDYTMIYYKNSFSYIIIYVNDLKTDSENDNDKVNMPSFPSPEPTVSCLNYLDFFKDFENEFPAIVYNDALTSKSDFLTKPTLSPRHIDEFDLKDETSLSECDEEEQNVLYFNDVFPFNIIYPDDSKSDKDNDDDKIDIKRSSGNMSAIPLPNVINNDDGSYAHASNKLLEAIVKAHVILLPSQLLVKPKNEEITKGIIRNYYDGEDGETTPRVLYKVEDIATCLVKYVKFWEDWEVDRYGNANLDYCSEDQYAVSIKEDTAYPCLHSPKTTKGMKINTPYPEDSIRRIQDMESI